MPALLVGLTGGIGAGKTEVTRRLADRGAVIIDADLLAREVVEPGTPGLARLVAEFGPGVLGVDGSLDRMALGERVFADAGLRGRLNGIVHPLVRAETARRVAAAPADRIVVNDVPLLVEAGLTGGVDVVVVVEADPQVRLARLTGDRGMTPEQARARMAAQADPATRLAAADLVVRNDAGPVELDAEVDRLWAELLRRRRPGRAVTG